MLQMCYSTRTWEQGRFNNHTVNLPSHHMKSPRGGGGGGGGGEEEVQTKFHC